MKIDGKANAWSIRRFTCEVKVRVWSLIVYSDTTPTRLMLALAAAGWALLLWAPGDTFTRPVYRYMAIVASENVWAAFWSLHAIGMFWRIFAKKPCMLCAITVNLVGVALFSSSAIAIFLTLTYPLPAAIAPDIVFALAAIWCLVRTGVNSELGWRID